MNPVKDALRSRISVSAVFFANGLFVGCWAVLIPVLIKSLEISESEMGLIILSGGFAAILALALSAKIIDLLGARAVMMLSAIGLAPSLFIILQSQSFLTAAIILGFIMAFLAFQDVAMNANAADLELQAKKPIMSAFHGFWSTGAMVGALTGGPAIALIESNYFALITGFIIFTSCLVGYPYLEQKSPVADGLKIKTGLLPAQWLPWMFGVIAFVGFVSEGAVIDWSAHFFRKELASGVYLSGFAFGGFSFSMLIARFFGDRLRLKIGDMKLLIASVLLAGAGLIFVALAPNALMAVLGFFLAGFGNANIVPIAFSASATIKDLPKGMGIATASFCGYAGLLVAPASLGYLGEHMGFKTVYTVMGIMLFTLLFLAPMVGRQTKKRIVPVN